MKNSYIVHYDCLNAVACDMLLATREDRAADEEIDLFYRAFSQGGGRGDLNNRAAATLCLEMFISPNPEFHPSLMQTVTPTHNAWIGYDRVNHSAARLSTEGVLTITRPEADIPLSSVYTSKERVYMLAGNGSIIWRSNTDLEPRSFKKIPVALEAGSTIIQMDAGALTLFSVSSRSIIRLDQSMRVKGMTRLAGNSIIHHGTTYRDGVLLTESFQGASGGGNLLYIPKIGVPVHLAGGLFNPTHISVFEHGALVCDFAGLHVFFIDELNVYRTTVIPWQSFLKSIGRCRGIGYEAFSHKDGLYIAFKFNAMLTSASLKFGIAYFSQSELF